jgi:hypothetical protein
MSQSNRDALIEQLRNDPDPKVRRRACQRLAASRDPAVIPLLRAAYINDDDERVRETAGDALAVFKALHEGKTVRRLPVSDHTLRRIVGGLAILLVVSLLANVSMQVLGSIKDSDKESSVSLEGLTPTGRTELVAYIQEKLTQGQALVTSLKGEIKHYNDTGQVACPLSYQMPAPVGLSLIDNYTYPDLRIIGAKLDAAFPPTQTALVLLNSACSDPTTQTEKVIRASAKLDQADGQLREVNDLLQRAISNPAPTVGPTITPIPTRTFTPTPTYTPAPITPTASQSATEAAGPTSSPLQTVTPRATVTPAPTLPFPQLDYTQILRDLSQRYVVLGDLKNNYGTGMIDQWQKSTSAEGQTSSSFCTLTQWPEPFTLTDAQLAELNKPTVADPQLEEAIRLQQQALDLASQARTLYERDCAALALANSAQEGISLAQQAFDKLTQSQEITGQIRARPKP